ncbi:MAG: hypothetical protein ACI9MR_001309 [Myxococcota bacterium]|jgi:hypothetical protein
MRFAPFPQLLDHGSARRRLAQNGQTPGRGAHVRAVQRGRFPTKVEKPRTLLASLVWSGAYYPPEPPMSLSHRDAFRLALTSVAALALLACASSRPAAEEPLFGDGMSILPAAQQRLFTACEYELSQHDAYDKDNWRNCRGATSVRMFEHRWYDAGYNPKAAVEDIERRWVASSTQRKVLAWDKVVLGGEQLPLERVRYDKGGPGSVVATYVTTDDGHVYVCQVDAYVGARAKSPAEMVKDHNDCQDGIAAMHSVVTGQ